MSGIYINAPMPPEGKYVHFCVHGDGRVITDYTGEWEEYKAIHVPDHYDLVDVMEAAEYVNHYGDDVWLATNEIPVIIPGDKEET